MRRPLALHRSSAILLAIFRIDAPSAPHMTLKRRRKERHAEQLPSSCNAITNGVVLKPTPMQQKWKQEYYDYQSRLGRLYEEDKKLLNTAVPRKDDGEEPESQMVLYSCLALNILSLVGNLAASILSGSLSIMSTFVDSSMDLVCSGVMNGCMRFIEKADTFNYPRGRERQFRLESIGVLICAVLMAFANVGMAMQAVHNITDSTSRPDMTPATIAIVGVQTALKALLSWVCYKKGTPSSIVVAMDLRCLDHLMVYHTGAKAFVELHIVMDERLPLKVTHDISHPLEKKLQRLEFVERAFVHCDYFCDGD
ncbi:unnamed protein product [Nippostrongylus brasiliensis]|uniref:ZT_dimer domain-containing protein n=1 Tax=Nippostrongylus brasiliensis TaxID=27835 RepID=A0A0N4YGC6_NIPBR|nr:unnamed protein product [Nippostrongylus brasiliensis]